MHQAKFSINDLNLWDKHGELKVQSMPSFTLNKKQRMWKFLRMNCNSLQTALTA